MSRSKCKVLSDDDDDDDEWLNSCSLLSNAWLFKEKFPFSFLKVETKISTKAVSSFTEYFHFLTK